ncbi:aminoglycoside phosphotransferase family protein [Saccharothrix sp. S26]|uniref:phosphotransferase n=1 Tax=Saccharothrix sp. S26 TaxID=2907215 RepID=UPI001F1F9171|nr:phosphotransferase [Saccharothrix sp. S26]MCE7000632.1 aminoglycoside phosphotransferase family protein [Saccharothrix sp. S26]
MREIRALVTVGGRYVGAAEPFTVDSPWWNDVEPVTTRLDEVLGVTTSVLRLVGTTTPAMRDGVVTYQVEADRVPERGLSADSPPHEFPDHPLRLPWARPGGPAALVAWARRHVDVTGPPVQVKTWNLSCLYRLPTADGTVWAKATPPFMADEAEVIRLVASVDPSLAPRLIASEPGRVLLAEASGVDCWQPGSDVVERIVPRWVAVQAALAGEPRLRVRGVGVPAFGLPDTVLHGDFHPGNWRSGGVVLDWGDAHWGHPALDAARLIGFVAPEFRPSVERVWVDAWSRHFPSSDPASALRHARPASHLVGAVVYQEFLDNIEPSERVYHLGDPEAELERAQSLAV